MIYRLPVPCQQKPRKPVTGPVGNLFVGSVVGTGLRELVSLCIRAQSSGGQAFYLTASGIDWWWIF